MEFFECSDNINNHSFGTRTLKFLNINKLENESSGGLHILFLTNDTYFEAPLLLII